MGDHMHGVKDILVANMLSVCMTKSCEWLTGPSPLLDTSLPKTAHSLEEPSLKRTMIGGSINLYSVS